MKNFWRIIKYLLAMTVMIALVIILAACATIPYSQDIPEKVVEWNETNSWKVIAGETTGTTFWLTEDTLITACHIVDEVEKIFVQSPNKDHLVSVEKVACSSVYDLALLKFNDEPIDFKPLPTIIAPEMPRRGTVLYSGGYALGKSMMLTKGYLQTQQDKGYITSVSTVGGDSGAPVVMFKDGKVLVVGVRVAVMVLPMGLFKDIITHISRMKGSAQLIEFLKENGQVYT